MLATSQKYNNGSITNEPDPKVVEAFYSLYHSKEFKIFEIKIKELINYYPYSMELMNIYSVFLIEQKKYSEAILFLERIIKIKPSNFRSTLDLEPWRSFSFGEISLPVKIKRRHEEDTRRHGASRRHQPQNSGLRSRGHSLTQKFIRSRCANMGNRLPLSRRY